MTRKKLDYDDQAGAVRHCGCGVVMQYLYTRQIRRMRANELAIEVTRAWMISQ
ncbi:MAG: hypothetical protein M3R61_15490 [Chloroflexota bacterium]|nr:hypothetical protein [Chloroflexota bacterium]